MPDAAPAPVGLLVRPLPSPTGRGARHSVPVPVPLTGVVVDADVVEWCARVTITQRYVNREAQPIEAVYVFPLDEGAAVCGFEAIVDGATIVAEAMPRDAAFEAYDDAMARGDSAFLLDEERPDVFQVSVGNVPPGGEVLLRLTYVTELPAEGDAVRFVIPTTVSPRYAPAEDRTGVGRPDADVLNPPVEWRVPYGLTYTARLRMPGAITRVESPSHPIATTLAGATATVTLAQGETALDCDLVLIAGAEGLGQPHAWVERDADGRLATAIAFRPVLPEVTQPAEVVFVVDRSGSMGGTSIEEVRRALQLCLRSLSAGCAFDIVGFGDTWTSLFTTSRAYDETSLREASAHIQALDADLGGTEILPALKAVLTRPVLPGLTRQVIVLTDGEVSNTDAVIALVKAHAVTARVFTFGIGAGASEHLVRGIARAGGGAAEFIAPGERIEPKVLRQFAKLFTPALTDIRVDWGGAAVEMAPSVVPPVFQGGRLLVYGLLGEGTPATVRLTATQQGQNLSFEVPLDASAATAGRTIATLAARARIRELEEGGTWRPARGSAQHARRGDAAVRAIVDLAVRYGLASRETSLVAVHRREVKITGEVQLRRVPIALTKGWGGVEDQATLSLSMRQARIQPSASPAFDGLSEVAYCRADSAEPPSMLRRVARMLSRDQDAGPTELSEPSLRRRQRARSSPFDDLVAAQRADGSWRLDAVSVVARRDVGELRAALPAHAGDQALAEVAWATALAVAWLVRHAADRGDEWHMLADKAVSWLNACGVRPVTGTWEQAALAFVNA